MRVRGGGCGGMEKSSFPGGGEGPGCGHPRESGGWRMMTVPS